MIGFRSGVLLESLGDHSSRMGKANMIFFRAAQQ